MSQCSLTEISLGYIETNPGTALKTVVIDQSKEFSVMTVFNETDQAVKVNYKNQNGDIANFIVPKGGRAFTRVINGKLLNNSLQINAITTAATGNVIINLGN